MTSPEPNPKFDAAAVASQLLGTWCYPAADEPSGVGYLHFHRGGRVFQFIYDPHQPARRLAMRLDYSLEAPAVMRLRKLKGDQSGWTIQYQFEGNTLRLIDPKNTYLCTRVPRNEVPVWFQEAIAKYL